MVSVVESTRTGPVGLPIRFRVNVLVGFNWGFLHQSFYRPWGARRLVTVVMVVESTRTRPTRVPRVGKWAAGSMLWKISVLRKFSGARVGTGRIGFAHGPGLIWRGRS
jgi:hypothetical protein